VRLSGSRQRHRGTARAPRRQRQGLVIFVVSDWPEYHLKPKEPRHTATAGRIGAGLTTAALRVRGPQRGSRADLRTGSRGTTAAPPEHTFGYGVRVAELPIPELVENHLRSVAMLTPGEPALNREEALSC
jgi:hypothetical protein